MSTFSQQVFDKLVDRFGPQHWWPAESPLEVIVGAVLVQNTSWRHVERALDNMRRNQLLSVDRILAAEVTALETLLRPAGYFRLKAQRLRSVMQFIQRDYHGSIDAMKLVDMNTLREQLLGVNGIGPETADAILLYALDQPAMVVDAYTRRVYARHGWVKYDVDYHQLQQHLVGELPAKVTIYNEMHALLVEVGKTYCRTAPQCDKCPLAELLPESGIVDSE
ncbi:MAG: endonuclease III domain-containing protein [Planctomycetota bacterium]